MKKQKNRAEYLHEYYKRIRVPKNEKNIGTLPQKGWQIKTGLSKDDPEYHKTRHRMMRLLALQMISKRLSPICVMCGCTELELLQINHKNGGGRNEHKRLKGENVYALVIRGRRSTDDLDVRCMICNIHHYVGLKYPDLFDRFKIMWT